MIWVSSAFRQRIQQKRPINKGIFLKKSIHRGHTFKHNSKDETHKMIAQELDIFQMII